MGIALVSIGALLYAISVTISKSVAAKSKSVFALPVLFQIATGLFFLVGMLFVPIQYTLDFNSLTLLLAAIILYGFFNLSLFQAYKYIDVSVSSVIVQLSLVISFGGSLIIFNEAASVARVLGVVLILVANLVLFLKRSDKVIKLNKQGILWAIAAAVIVGFVVLIDAKNSPNFSFMLYGFLTFFFPGIVVYLYGRPNFGEIKLQIKTSGWKILVMALTTGIAFYLLLSAYQLGNKSVISTLFSLNNVFVALAGIFILGEKTDIKRKIIAALLAFLGAWLLSM